MLCEKMFSGATPRKGNGARGRIRRGGWACSIVADEWSEPSADLIKRCPGIVCCPDSVDVRDVVGHDGFHSGKGDGTKVGFTVTPISSGWRGDQAGDAGATSMDGDQCGCPFCRGDVASEIVEKIKEAAAGRMSAPMNLDESMAWLAAFPDPVT